MDHNKQEHDFREAIRQFVEIQLSGKEPDIEELVGKYPKFEHEIRRKLREFHRVDSLFDSLVQADASDFDATAAGHGLTGQKVGAFEITEMIGRGGMGVVYLARDTKLDRSVAIKSMPAELQANSTAQARFQREAKLLASLNHPNIAAIYDILEQDDDSSYLVLEYIPGQTLRERIADQPLKLEEILSIGRQIAEALAGAYEQGVIHRDLKPSNVKITPDGRIKILDFGLAKATETQDKKAQSVITQAGRIVGTPAYMSPEQARGHPTDHRTDIWSFGCVMYEMLCARLPFEGDTATDTLARVIEREPDWQVLPQETPTNIRTLLRRCLEKKPQQRLQHIGDAVIEIQETLNLPASAAPVTTPSSMLLKPRIHARHRLRTAATIAVTAFVIILSVVAVQLVSNKEAPPSSKEIRLVVLPFENLGPDEEEWFANGMTVEIANRLGVIPGLDVISQPSARQYKDRAIATPQIAKDLNVAYILNGAIQRARPSDPNSPVRIRVQLINASKDTQIWAETYDDDMSEVFQVQSDLAEQVAQALDITLLKPERRTLASRPTENPEAYDYYLRGERDRARSYSDYDYKERGLKTAIRRYERAVELDPVFALAYAKLCIIHCDTYKFNYDPSQERLAEAKQAVYKAFELDPELPEAHLALGHYYCILKDKDRALEQFAIVRKSQPNNAEAIAMMGYLQEGQGKFEQALTNFNKDMELNPRNFPLLTHVGHIFQRLRKYSEAERCHNHAISLAPGFTRAYIDKAWLYLRWQGSTEKARAVVEAGIKSTERPLVSLLATLDVFDRNYPEALDRFSLKSQDEASDRLSLKSQDLEILRDFIPNSLQCARICLYMGKEELAKKHYDDARSIIESRIEERPEKERLHGWLGIAYAGLGRKEDAIRKGKLAVELVGKHAMKGPDQIEDLARIYVMVGEHDAAINQLEYLLSIPGTFSLPLLRLDPAWDPLREHPRFKQLVGDEK
jgi:eukaryotic-like serine/threonine-protein kinase